MNIFKSWRIWGIVTFLFIFSGCATFQMEISKQAPLPEVKNSTLVAGMAKADITPAPGMPLAGYSMMANYGKGFRTRLYVRTLYLKPQSGRAVAIVQGDFLTGSIMLNQRVAELIAKDTDVGIDGLLIAGTHTHSGPGNFFDNNFYNDNASNARGFDPDYFKFISEQIANTIITAYKEKRPAKIATANSQIWKMTRNRSIESYLANKNIASKTPLPDIYEAVNPNMYMIRVDVLDKDGQYKPLGALSSFSIHGTTLGEPNKLYNGDIFAYIEREVEYGIKDQYKTSWEPIHVAFNGTHGDSSPNYSKQGFIESRRIGTSVGKQEMEVFRSLDGKLKDNVTINFAAKEIDVFTDYCIDDTCLCDRPVVGSALAAGADDGPSPVISKLPWLRQGSPRWIFTNFCQGHKRTLVGPLQYLVLLKKNFPHNMFLQTIQIDDVLLIPLPFETTIESGNRIAKECKDKLASANKNDLKYFPVISIANGYYGYVTTPEEYSKQRYEGGHTLYGPKTQPFLAKQVSKLALELGQDNRDKNFPAKWSYDLNMKRFIKGEAVDGIKRKAIDAPSFVSAKTNEEPYWSFVWEDMPPYMITWSQTMVGIEESQDGISWKQLQQNGQPVNDSGYDVAVMLKDVTDWGKIGVYETRWYNPPAGEKGSLYRFAILPQKGQDAIYSKSFN